MASDAGVRTDDYTRPDSTTTVSADRPKTPAKGAVKRVEIEVADNGGFKVSVYRKATGRAAKSMFASEMAPAQTATFEHWYGAEAYVGKELGVDRGEDMDAGEDAADAAATKKAAAGTSGGSATAGSDTDDEDASGEAGDDEGADADDSGDDGSDGAAGS